MNHDFDTINQIFGEADVASLVESTKCFKEVFGGKDAYPCGFAWVEIYGIRANSKVGKFLAELGMRKDSYSKCFIYHSNTPNVQNMDVKYEGARAAAKVLQNYGFRAYATSRID